MADSKSKAEVPTPEAAAPAPTPRDTLALWNRLKRTDPKATKPFSRVGGFRGTQIDPTWRFQMMTETFGPVGKGWGWEQLDWTIAERMVFICARVWYVDPESGEKCWTGPQWGGTEMVRRRRDGEMPDDECFKMSMTDAIGKCMLSIGLGADVYLGQFDDSKYREESEAYFAARQNPDLQPEAIEKFEADIKKRLATVLDIEDLEEVWRGGAAQRLRDIGTVDRAAQHRITGYFSQKKAEIVKREEEGRRAA
ncbi:MAG TPA: hypothetical protein VEB64_01790 [Azospirillaceae bacterium]|nr:hypothetical protein [Azospirillaceae bacterium]